MIELTQAVELVDVIGQGSVYAYWTPGDGTVYRVFCVNGVPYNTVDALDQANDLVGLLVFVGRTTWTRPLFIPKPTPGAEWTAERFLHAFGVPYAASWPGLRPVLAVLRWTPTDERNTTYDEKAAVDIVALIDGAMIDR